MVGAGSWGSLPVAASLIPLSACMVVTDTVPDVQYLFCLLFGLIILILTSRVRRQSALRAIA